MGNRNAELARELFDAVQAGNTDKVASFFSDDVIVHVPGNNQISGTFKGRGEVGTTLGKIAQLTDGTFRRELHDITASDAHAVVLTEITAERGGKRFTFNSAVVLDIQDGKIAQQWFLNDDQATVDELFA